MNPEHLISNIAEIAKNAVPKIPRKWSNVQAISIKTPDSVALPIYSSVPSLLDEIDQEMSNGVDETISKKNETPKGEKVEKKTEAKKAKSPLLQALKSVNNNEKKKKRKESIETKNEETRGPSPEKKRK